MIFDRDQLRAFVWGSGKEKWATAEGLASIGFVLYATLLTAVRLHRAVYVISAGAVVAGIVFLIVMLRRR